MLIKSRLAIYLNIFKQKINFSMSSTQIDIGIQYPFEYTFNQSAFTYYDYRFTQQPLPKKLNSSQINHYIMVLTNFEKYLNSKALLKSLDSEKFIHPLLSQKLRKIHEILKSEQIETSIKFNTNSIKQRSGYLEIYGWNQEQSIKEKFMHELQFERDRERLLIRPSQAQLRKIKTLKQQMVQDIQENRQSKHLENMQNQLNKSSKFKKQFFRLVDFVMKKRTSENNQKIDFFTSDLICGTYDCVISANGQRIEMNDIGFKSKWLYYVNFNESEDIRESRKRVMYDFQHWNRGTFIPVKNFIQSIK